MRRRILSVLLTLAMVGTMCTAAAVPASADEPVVYKQTPRIMEELNRGLIAVKTTSGVYLSWRVLGKEDLATTAYDIYREGTNSKIATIEGGQASNYIDKSGTSTSKYKVVVSTATQKQIEDEPWTQAQATKGNDDYTYYDIPISMPVDIPHANTTALSDYKRKDIVKDGKKSGTGGGANDASLGDLDGDGDYEIVLKWDPNNSKDSNSGNTTGHCVFDAYEIDSQDNGYMWRIDIGNNIAAGPHYSQFMVYDLDSDGKAEIATITAPGSYSLVKNDAGEWEKIYVTTVGDTEEIRNADNNATTLRKGNNNGPEYYTIFDGETGRPLRTTAAIPLGKDDGSDWGDNKMNRSERYLAAVAYLDGVNPYYVPIRGMYNRTVIRAYSWDGENLTLVKEHDGRTKGSSMYGEGNHNLNVADIDNDGKDEIVYGSACLDDDFKTVLGNTKMGHGDAMHTSDFNNDGKQEVFSVKEDPEGYSRAADFRFAETGNAIWSKSITSGDNGRGFMDNVCDEYAAAHPEALALGFSASTPDVYDFKGNSVGVKPNTSRQMMNFGVYWDADLGRELLDDTIMGKYTYNKSTGVVEFGRIFFANKSGYLPGTANNSTKYTPCLVADIWGDWREEIIMAVDDTSEAAPKLRIITPIAQTQYRLTTLMHDSQYRTAIAWQNVGYNQPPHTSYYIGSAALAKDASGNTLNYLAPKTPFDTIMYPSELPNDPIEDIEFKHNGDDVNTSETIELERTHTYQIDAQVLPDTVKKKGIKWTSSDTTLATVNNGLITAVGREGDVTITATASGDEAVSKSVTVHVYSTPVTGVTLSGKNDIVLLPGGTTDLTGTVVPGNASDQKITWESTNPNVATVDSSGHVTAVGDGTTIIRVISNDGGFYKDRLISVAGKVTDYTGEDEFVTTNTDANTTFSKTKNSASFTHTKATTPAEFHKDFETVADKKSTLHFNFTTGGAKESDKYIWILGHGFNTYIKFLDTEGKNILTVREEHKNGSGTGVSTQYTLGESGEYKSMSDWKKIADGTNSPFNRSQIRWDVTLEIDKAADSATITWAGCNNDFVPDETYQYTFKLNGATFKTLKYEMGDITDWVSGSPSLKNLSYTVSEPTTGASAKVYDKATMAANKWTENDLNGWTTEGTAPTATDNGFGYSSISNPGAGFHSEKTVSLTDGALVTYDVDWVYHNVTGRDSNKEYIQFGPVKIAASNDGSGGYFTRLSTDGGATWDPDGNGSVDNVVAGSNALYTRNIHLVIDTKENKIKDLKIDGTDISYCRNLAVTSDSYGTVSFGFERGGSANNTSCTNMLKNLTVLQFLEGETPKCLVQFVNDDGTVLNEQRVETGTTVTYSGEAPTKAGDDKYENYVFAGWNPDPSNMNIDDDTVFTAQYTPGTPKTYTVTLNLNDGSVQGDVTQLSYTYGEGVELPAKDAMSKTGNTFVGWYDNDEFIGDPVVRVNKNETGNKTYFAKWKPETYAVELNLNDGTLADDENITSYTYGAAVPLPTPKKKGHDFKGWCEDQACESEGATEIPEGSTGAKTYYAKWERGHYTITYDWGGATPTEGAPEGYDYGDAVTLPTPTQNGYTFDGWYTDAAYSGSAVESITAEDEGNKKYYAKWTPETYTVTLNLNDGTLADEDNIKSYTYGTEVTLPTAEKITKTGHSFAGWYEDAQFGGDPVDKIAKGSYGNKTYYAKWEIGTYSITYNLLGGTQGADAPAQYTYGDTVPLPTPTWDGYTFDGWYTSEDYSGSKVEGITATDEGAKKFYAKWTSLSPVIEYASTAEDGKTVTVYAASAAKTDKIIGALYDGTKLVEVKTADVSAAENFWVNVVYANNDLMFTNDVSKYDLKLFIWNGLGENGLQPIAAVPAVKAKEQ